MINLRTRDRTRRALLGAMPINRLRAIADETPGAPENADRPTLIEVLVEIWPAAKIERALHNMMLQTE